MPTESSPSPRRLPTVAELLETPAIRALADRLNRNAVVAGVRSFVDELRGDLIHRDASQWPSLRELAERAAQYMAAVDPTSPRIAINATGQAWGGRWLGRPQNDAALARTFAYGREFVLGSEAAGGRGLSKDCAATVCRATGAEAVVAVHSYVGALWLAVAALCTGRRGGETCEIVVSRGEVGELEVGCPLGAIVASAGAALRDVGAANRTVAADYETAVNDRTAALARVRPEGYSVVGASPSVSLEELVGIARDREIPVIDAIGAAPLVDMSAEISCLELSVQASVAAGANLVIARGDGLLGGPASGILAGDGDLLERVTAHALFAAHQLDPPRAAALAAALEQQAGAQEGGASSPLASLLISPLENLRNRAVRIADQLVHARGIAAVSAIATTSSLDGLALGERNMPSFGIAITPEGSAAAFAQRLASRPLPIIGRVEAERVVLDLRTVPPRHDQEIVRAVTGGEQGSAVELTGAAGAPR